MNKQVVYLDMDGTIANLYEQPNWLQDLTKGNIRPFAKAQPMITEQELLSIYPKDQYELRVCSMTPKNATKDYCERVARAKDKWLDKYFPTITHRVYMKYGNNKNLKNCRNHILIDDNETIRNNFKGQAYYPMWA